MIEKNIFGNLEECSYMIDLNLLTNGNCEGCHISTRLIKFPFYIMLGRWFVTGPCSCCYKVDKKKWDKAKREHKLLIKMRDV